MSIKNKFSKERMAKFFDREGFYIVLFLCVCIVAVTAVWVSRIGSKKNTNINDTGDKNTTVVTPAGNSKETSSGNTQKTETQGKGDKEVAAGEKSGNGTAANETTTSKVTPVPVKTSTSASVKFSNPIDDVLTQECIIRKYSPTDLVTYEAMGYMRIHNGIDINVYEGTEVLAVYRGKVTNVWDDNEYDSGRGWSVEIDHGNGLKTVYSNLNEKIAVKKGDTVKVGQKLGVVGNSSLVEKSLSKDESVDSHLHFEVLKKGAKSYENVDPSSYLTIEK